VSLSWDPLEIASPPRSSVSPLSSQSTRRGQGRGGRVLVEPLRILWIDDEVELFQSFVRFLNQSGCEVEMVADGATGLACAQRGRSHVIVLDWRLPDRSGFDVLRQLRLKGCRLPILLLSGYADVDLAVEAMQLGASTVKRKPISPEKLLAAVRTLGPTPGGPALTPWTARTCALLEDLRVACADDAPVEVRMSGRDVVRRFAMTLADSDISIPEVMAGVAAFKTMLSAPLLDADDFADLRQVLAGAVIDLRDPHPTVASAVARLESAGSEGVAISEDELAADVFVTPSYLGDLLKMKTPLPWARWKMGLRLRPALRHLASDARLIKEIASECGWSSAEQFTHQFHAFVGLSPTAFRELLN